jgi:geranylgeranyl diphosphate synthase type II
MLTAMAERGGAPRLAAAMQHAVFPAGARIRPRLCLAVAQACGAPQVPSAVAAAAAIELLHCASLVHDDLPCFDNADRRRGRPSVHRAFGERLAVLAGDALIVASFEAIALERQSSAEQRVQLLTLLAQAAGMPRGLAAGQAWECEPACELGQYQRAKTGSLFSAATAAGAIAAGVDPEAWFSVGESIGEAYQVADDICDVSASGDAFGKPTRRDAALGRPNAVNRLGMPRAREHLQTLVSAAIERMPRCPGADALQATFRGATEQLLVRCSARPAA